MNLIDPNYLVKLRNPKMGKKAGNRYGILTAVQKDPLNPGKYIVQCDCGNTKSVATGNLRENGGNRSCGCLRGRPSTTVDFCSMTDSHELFGKSYRRSKECFIYLPRQGKLINKINRRIARQGEDAGRVIQQRNTSYRIVKIDYQPIYEHRLVWLMTYGYWPLGQIDHIDGNGLNNRLSNLRDVPHFINQRNRRRNPLNTSGATGVGWHKHSQKWRAYVGIHGKQINLGSFESKTEAIAARQRFNSENGFTSHHGERA